MNVMVAALLGGFSLGQASPNLAYFSKVSQKPNSADATLLFYAADANAALAHATQLQSDCECRPTGRPVPSAKLSKVIKRLWQRVGDESFTTPKESPNALNCAQGRVSGAKLFKVIERTPQIDIFEEGEELETFKGTIELCDVAFAYPARPDAQIFSNFSLTVPAGQTVALVGSSGRWAEVSNFKV